jgi:hypothetical protein
MILSMKNIFYCIFIFPLLFISCKRDMIIFNDDIENSSVISIRIKNSSSYDFKNVKIYPGDNAKNFGDVRRGEISAYQNFEEAFNDMTVTLIINNIEFNHVPGNPSGIEMLGTGKFTIEISILNFAQRKLSFVLHED